MGSAVGGGARWCDIKRCAGRCDGARPRRDYQEWRDGALPASENYLRSNPLPSGQLVLKSKSTKHQKRRKKHPAFFVASWAVCGYPPCTRRAGPLRIRGEDFGTAAAPVRHRYGTGAAPVRVACGTGAERMRNGCGVRNGCGTGAERRRNAGGTPADLRRGVLWLTFWLVPHLCRNVGGSAARRPLISAPRPFPTTRSGASRACRPPRAFSRATRLPPRKKKGQQAGVWVNCACA